MAGKYTPLQNYLKNRGPNQREITLTFEQIERIINDTLPDSAKHHRAWWGNEQEGSHVNAHAWMNAGWKVDTVDLTREFAIFRR